MLERSFESVVLNESIEKQVSERFLAIFDDIKKNDLRVGHIFVKFVHHPTAQVQS